MVTVIIAGNFRGQNIIFVIAVSLQVKLSKVASFVRNKIDVATKTTNILLHEKYPLYGISKPKI